VSNNVYRLPPRKPMRPSKAKIYLWQSWSVVVEHPDGRTELLTDIDSLHEAYGVGYNSGGENSLFFFLRLPGLADPHFCF